MGFLAIRNHYFPRTQRPDHHSIHLHIKVEVDVALCRERERKHNSLMCWIRSSRLTPPTSSSLAYVGQTSCRNLQDETAGRGRSALGRIQSLIAFRLGIHGATAIDRRSASAGRSVTHASQTRTLLPVFERQTVQRGTLFCLPIEVCAIASKT